MSTFSQQITNGANDTSVAFSAWSSTGLWVGNFSGRADCHFLFTGVTIANGSTVSAATLSYTSGHTGFASTSFDTKVGMSNEDNAASPTTYGDATGRSFTATPLSESTGIGGNPNSARPNSDVTGSFHASAQELFNRAGWASGNNALVLYRNNASGSGTYRTVDDYATYPSTAASISVTYTAAGGASPYRPHHFIPMALLAI